jgi:hypothetical protein
MTTCNPKEYICIICNKEYSCRQNLWKHNQKNHVNDNTNLPQKPSDLPQKPSVIPQLTSKLVCNYCNKTYSRADNLKRHMDKCKVKINNDKSKDEIIAILQDTIKQQQELFQKQFIEMKKQLLDTINKQCKKHPKTLQKINNQLNANNNTINSNNTINILALGHEDLAEVFSKKEKLTVLKNKFNCLPYLIEYAHFNDKFPQFKNIIITNMQNSIAYKYDYKLNQFVAIDKNELLDDLIGERIADIEAFYDELEAELDDKTKKIIEKVLDKMEIDPAYKEEKKKEIKLIIYNNRNKVSKDLEIII